MGDGFAPAISSHITIMVAFSQLPWDPQRLPSRLYGCLMFQCTAFLQRASSNSLFCAGVGGWLCDREEEGQVFQTVLTSSTQLLQFTHVNLPSGESDRTPFNLWPISSSRASISLTESLNARFLRSELEDGSVHGASSPSSRARARPLVEGHDSLLLCWGGYSTRPCGASRRASSPRSLVRGLGTGCGSCTIIRGGDFCDGSCSYGAWTTADSPRLRLRFSMHWNSVLQRW